MKGEDMKSKLYKLAFWYIGKCNAEWNKRKFTDELKSLDRLTYWNFGKYMLVYGADAEWRIFGRYEVLDNAIQKLAEYENNNKSIRNQAITEFAERCNKKITEFVLEHQNQLTFVSGVSMGWKIIDEVAEEMKGEQ